MLTYSVGAYWHGFANNAMTEKQRLELDPTSEEYSLRYEFAYETECVLRWRILNVSQGEGLQGSTGWLVHIRSLAMDVKSGNVRLLCPTHSKISNNNIQAGGAWI